MGAFLLGLASGDQGKKQKKGSDGKQAAIDQMPGQVAPQFGTETTPQMNQLPMYHDGGDVPSDQVAKLKGGERVLNPTEAHAYKSAALGNAPDTPLGRISARANDILDQLGQANSEAEENAKAIRAKRENIDALKAQGDAMLRPLQPNNPPAYAPVEADKLHPNATYGSRPGEKRLDPQGNEINPTTPQGMRALGPQRPVPAALGSLPSYDEGGDVPNDQVAKVHEDEHVLDPKEAAAYRQAEAEEKQSQGAPVDFPGRVMPEPKSGPVQVKADTDPAGNPDKPVGAVMNTDLAPAEPVNERPVPLRPAEEGSKEPVISEASVKSPIGKINAPRNSAMKPFPGTQPLQVQPEAPKPEAVPEPDINAIIQQDKMTAAQKGHAGLADLGLAMIHENAFSKPIYKRAEGDDKKALEEKGKAEYQQTVDTLKDKMLHAPTEQERFQAEKDLAEYKRKTPWGSAESAHPGMLGKIGHVLGQVGQTALKATAPYVLPVIPGSQEGLQGSEARGEQGVEQAQKKNLTTAQIAEEQQKPEVAKERANVAQQATDVKQQEADTKQERVESQEVLDAAKANAQNAIAELKKAQADPSSPANQAIIEKAKQAGRKIDIAAGKLGIDSAKYKADYLGLGPNNEPLAGVETTAEGKPIGVKVGKANEATSQRLNKADLSQNVQLNVKNANKLIDEHPELFGKVAGRFTNAQQMIGSNDPAISRLGIEIHNAAVASAGIHGQRGQAAVEAYEKDLLNRFHNSPEATKAGLNELSGSVQTFIDDAKSGKKVAPTPKTPEEIKTGIPEGATHTYKDKSGKIVGYALDGKYHALATK